MRTRIFFTRSVTDALLEIQQAVRDHPYYAHADLPRKKLLNVLKKLRERLPDLEKNRQHAYKRRLRGLPSHRLIIYFPRKHGHTGFFVLMASTNEPNVANEKWQDARERHQRLTIRSGWWELVRHTRAGMKNPAWTWRLHPAKKKELLEKIRQAGGRQWIRYLEAVRQSARHWPGFAGIRKDHSEIGKQWRASYPSKTPPEWPRIPYVSMHRRKKQPSHPPASGDVAR